METGSSDTTGPGPTAVTGSKNQVENSKSNNRNNRNRERNRNKNKKNKSATSDATDERPKSENKGSKAKKGPKDTKSSKSGTSNKPDPPKALYKELQKLLSSITPITINGIPVKNLSSEPLPFLEKIINDKTNKDEIFMTFFLKPSDPDFPFDLELLTLTLCIPQSYPKKLSTPTLMVLNDDIPRGYSLNIEIGFKQIVSTILEKRWEKKKDRNQNKKEPKDSKDRKETKEEAAEGEGDSELRIDVVGGNDLLGMVRTLDKYLEKFLSMEKKDTIKLVKVINRKQEVVNQQEKKKTPKSNANANASNSASVHKPELSKLDQERYAKRTVEIEKFKQRLRNNSIKVIKDNPPGTTFKLCLYFKDDHLTLEFDECSEICIEKLFITLNVPKEYLNNPRKGLKLAIDMSNDYNIDLVNSIKDTSVRLIFVKLMNNIGKNFDTFASDVAGTLCSDSKVSTPIYWTITSQLNFFIHNIQKFMNERADFQSWYVANTDMNQLLQEKTNSTELDHEL